ncbi:NACHT domain-containing protein [Streptomyces sp. N2A]|uniref:NACHT domain-containing protein n=1 Tax=Streptomyces sp. N2A TaxID=3073936 RepID=UPI00286FF005|nr:NACHT domain-containing protein [Streptomyces sp. N2A]
MRRVPKWVGLLYVFLVGAFLAWYIVRGHKVDYLIAVVSAFTGLLALPAAVIAVLRPRKDGLALARLEDVADQLAQGVRQQWEAEAQVRRLNDPFPMSVEWGAADTDLVESWPHLRELAEDWTGQPSADSAWAVSPKGLAGEGGDIAQVFERVPTRRLVVLGEPGSGKTVLLIRLLLALLERRPPGGPLPILFPLAAWDPAQQDLYTWMADQLARDHPALRALVPANSPQASTGTQARALLQQRLILPILDGLDELPEAVRARALHAINEVLPARQPLVLSSRTAEYRHALTTSAGAAVLLNGAAGIRLFPLDPAKAATYLERDAGGPGTPAAARWDRVIASLGTDTPASQALSTPLGLFLTRTIYNPRPDEQFTDLSDPNELLDQERFPTRQDIDTHLFAAFIPAAYRPHPHHPTRWTAQKAQHALTFLARHLQHTLGGTPNLAWWQLPQAHPRHGQVLAVGLMVGLMVWFPLVFLFGFGVGFSTAMKAWLLLGLPWTVAAAGIASSGKERKPSSGIRWSWRGKSWLTVGLTIGPIFGLFFASFAATGTEFPAWLIIGLADGLLFALLGGVRPVHPDLSKAVGSGVVLARDRRTLSTLTLAGALAGALAMMLEIALEFLLGYRSPAALWQDLAFGLGFGLGVGLPVGLLIGLAGSVWMEFLVARIRLATLGHIPWHFMSFLADAHQRRGILRQVGAVYQFRHIDLQRHLAGHQP